MDTKAIMTRQKYFTYFAAAVASFFIIIPAIVIALPTQPLHEANTLVGMLSLMTIGYVLFIALSLQNTNRKYILTVAIITSVLVQVIFLFDKPFFNDFFRYLWDGNLSAHAINPFAYFPWEIANNASLSHLANVWYWDDMFFKWTYTIYGPTLQFVFWLSQKIALHSAFSLKFIFFFANIVSMITLAGLLKLKKLHSGLLTILILHPLFLFETMASGHGEAMYICLLLLTIYLFEKKKIILTGITLASLITTKYFPIIFIPALILKKWKSSFPFLVTKKYWIISICALSVSLLLFYIPFLHQIHPSLLIKGLTTYSENWVMSPGLFEIIARIANILHIPSYTRYFSFVLTAIVILISYIAYLKHHDIVKLVLFSTLGVIVFSSSVFSWYMLWLIPLIPLVKHKLPFLVLTISFIFQYLIITYDATEHMTFVYMHNGQILWHQLLLWIPAIITFLIVYGKKKTQCTRLLLTSSK